MHRERRHRVSEVMEGILVVFSKISALVFSVSSLSFSPSLIPLIYSFIFSLGYAKWVESRSHMQDQVLSLQRLSVIEHKRMLGSVGTTTVHRSSRGNSADPSTFATQTFHKYLSSSTRGPFPTLHYLAPNWITKSPAFLPALFWIGWGIEGQREMSCFWPVCLVPTLSLYYPQ